jgi:hypothetical protein
MLPFALRDRLRCAATVPGGGRLFDGFYKVEYQAGDVVGRSVMYVHEGRLLGGNSAFAHVGSYEVDGDEIVCRVAGQRHTVDPRFRTLYGADDDRIVTRGRADGPLYRFAGGRPQDDGITFRSVMTPLDEESLPPAGTVGPGGAVNGLYSVAIRLRDGLQGGLTGVMLLHDGRLLGGDAFFYYLGAYSSADVRWRGEIVNQEHTPASADPIFGGHEVGIGFSGACDAHGATWQATAFTGKRSLQLTATLTLLHRA